MNKLIFLSILIPNISFSQIPYYEQIAFDYFFRDIFNEEYPKQKAIQFNGHTMEERSYFFTFVGSCFERDINNEFKIKLMEVASEKKSLKREILLDSTNEVVNIKKNKANCKLDVYSETYLDDYHYVLIMLSFRTGQSYFFFEIEDNGAINRWCKTGIVY